MRAGADDRVASRLIVAWHLAMGHAFPLRGAPEWLVQDLAGIAANERRLRDGHQLLMSKARDEPSSIEDESARIKLGAMKLRAAVLEVPMGTIKSFGPFGPQYEVGGPLRQLDDGDWLIEVTLVAGGQKEEYRLSKVLEDPDAQ